VGQARGEKSGAQGRQGVSTQLVKERRRHINRRLTPGDVVERGCTQLEVPLRGHLLTSCGSN
jgi:hypothetical protein